MDAAGALACTVLLGLSTSPSLADDSAHAGASSVELPRDLRSYDDADLGVVAQLFHFLGEIEVVFGPWCVPVIVSVIVVFGWSSAVDYVSHKVNYTEPMFVVVIMTLASTHFRSRSSPLCSPHSTTTPRSPISAHWFPTSPMPSNTRSWPAL
jgi:hypothetical protein